jgi:predicted DNA-binding transcriptional regulator YafY
MTYCGHFLSSMEGMIRNMANTSSRALRLLSLLQNHRYWPGAELAVRLGVSPRTLRRDVDRLRELGYPVAAHRGVDGGYQLAPGAALPPLVVDDEEAIALTVGLRLATLGTAGIGDSAPGDSAPGDRARGPASDAGTVAEASARALAKVTAVLPARLRRRAEALAAMTEPATWDTARPGQSPDVNPDVLATAALACRDSERVRFDYTAASGERTRREAEPHRLVVLDRRWYLVAYDLTRQDWRSFRLDRVAGPVQPAGARFRQRELPADDAAEFVRRNIQSSPSPGYQVEAIIESPAAAVRERIGRWATVAEAGPGRCLVKMASPADGFWPVIALGMVEAEFRVVSPPELAMRIRGWSERFARATA